MHQEESSKILTPGYVVRMVLLAIAVPFIAMTPRLIMGWQHCGAPLGRSIVLTAEYGVPDETGCTLVGLGLR